jgi:hypothetical protein
MRLTAFQSGKGDCLLLETSDAKHRILIDGGMDDAYSSHVAPSLGKLRDNGTALDVVYVSHIDEDHISGVLQMLDDEAAWRVHEHQKRTGNAHHDPPSVKRPPAVGAIFHNSFHDLIARNQGPIEDALAATARILSGSDMPDVMKVAEERRDLVASIPQAMKVSQRIKPQQLNIPLNPHFGGNLMMVKAGMPDHLAVGTITLRVLGPFSEDLTKLRREWNDWLRKRQDTVKTIRADALRDQEAIGASEVGRALGPLFAAADQLGHFELAEAKKLGRRSKVTTPNLASLMFLAEEDGQRILLTGDGHADDILKGLDHHGALDPNGHVHVQVWKVQHHGSEHNTHSAFCDAVTADHYVWCGNGEHENPDLDIISLVHDRRMAGDERQFTFWFNSSSTLTVRDDAKSHMRKVETLVAKLATKSKDRLKFHFATGSSIRVR